MTKLTRLSDWLHAHRTLLDQERELAEVAQRYANGEASRKELEDAREMVYALRELANATLDVALGPLTASPRTCT